MLIKVSKRRLTPKVAEVVRLYNLADSDYKRARRQSRMASTKEGRKTCERLANNSDTIRHVAKAGIDALAVLELVTIKDGVAAVVK